MCGCGRRGTVRGFSAANRPKVVVGQSASGPSVGQLRALGLNNAAAATNNVSNASTNEERRRIEKLRRDAIRRKFNRQEKMKKFQEWTKEREVNEQGGMPAAEAPPMGAPAAPAGAAPRRERVA